MANDTYSAASGQGIFAGRFAPPVGTLSITSPKNYQMFQRDPNSAVISVSGTYTGTPTAIEASFAGGPFQTVTASPTGGTFTGTITAPTGQGNLVVRFANSHATNASVTTVGVGDIYIAIGDSNHSGRATQSVVQASSNNGLVSTYYARDNTWKPHQEGTATGVGTWDSDGQGSYFGALATLIMNNANVPVAFIPGARGSTTLDQWSVTENGANPYWVYGFALNIAQKASSKRKAVLCVLGTNPSSLDTAGATAAYNKIVNAYKASLGVDTVLYYAVNASAANNAAVADVVANNANAVQGPNFVGAWSGIHYSNAAEINVAAGRAWTALQALYYS